MTTAEINGAALKLCEQDGKSRIRLRFSPEWSGLIKQISFTNEKSGVCRRISADVAVCTVPGELFAAQGDIRCCVRGLDRCGAPVIRTNDEVLTRSVTENKM